ncbi:Xanthine dehydrogenase, partial [Pseudolycoriella hygida]
MPTLQDVINSSGKYQKLAQTTNTNVFDSSKTIRGRVAFGSQYHFTMEPQTTVCTLTDDGIKVYTSTQWTHLTQIAISRCLKVPTNSVHLELKRVGGGYGGKVSRGGQIACACALGCYLTRRPVRFVMTIESNMEVVGKRNAMIGEYRATVDPNGKIESLNYNTFHDAGCSFNEAITTFVKRSYPNCYDASKWNFKSEDVKTDAPSHTWCRAPGTLEMVGLAETVMEHISKVLSKDPMSVRLENMPSGSLISTMIPVFLKDVDFKERKRRVDDFNKTNRWRKKGIAIIPMEYPMKYHGMTTAYVAVYHNDGTVVVSHGGSEMGQGINTKVTQVVARAFGIAPSFVQVRNSDSVIGANCDPTGGSITSEMVCCAALKACEQILEQLKPIREKNPNAAWPELTQVAYMNQLSLKAVYTEREKDFKDYSVCALACAEIEADLLTGNIQLTRVDILEDVGQSTNPLIDIGQIEGAFTMGVGYWLTEDLVYDRTTGQLLTNRTWNYKPPGAKDIPVDFRVSLLKNSTNHLIPLRSKAVGEPAVTLAIVVVFALRYALQSARSDSGIKNDSWFELTTPATPEVIALAAGHSLDESSLPSTVGPRGLLQRNQQPNFHEKILKMGSVNTIPVVSQVKSGVQLVCGDTEGAKNTQEQFFHECPGVSQVVSLGYVLGGDTDSAIETQKRCGKLMLNTIDGIPVAGHIKGGIHYMVGDEEGGNKAMKSATRTTGVVAGGVGGFFLGGPLGAAAGGMYGGALTDVTTSLVTNEPSGYVAAIENAVNNPNPGDIFDLCLMPVADGLTGYTAGNVVKKLTSSQAQAGPSGTQTKSDVVQQQADLAKAGKLRAEAHQLYEAAEASSGKVPEMQTLTDMKKVQQSIPKSQVAASTHAQGQVYAATQIDGHTEHIVQVPQAPNHDQRHKNQGEKSHQRRSQEQQRRRSTEEESDSDSDEEDCDCEGVEVPVFYVNAGSINPRTQKAKIEKIREVIGRNQPAIIAIVETWLSNEHSDDDVRNSLGLSWEYTILRQDRDAGHHSDNAYGATTTSMQGRRGGGILIAWKPIILSNGNPLKLKRNANEDYGDVIMSADILVEMNCTKCNTSKNKKFIFTVVYRRPVPRDEPSAGDTNFDILERLTHLIGASLDVCQNYSGWSMVGDFNYREGGDDKHVKDFLMHADGAEIFPTSDISTHVIASPGHVNGLMVSKKPISDHHAFIYTLNLGDDFQTNEPLLIYVVLHSHSFISQQRIYILAENLDDTRGDDGYFGSPSSLSSSGIIGATNEKRTKMKHIISMHRKIFAKHLETYILKTSFTYQRIASINFSEFAVNFSGRFDNV